MKKIIYIFIFIFLVCGCFDKRIVTKEPLNDLKEEIVEEYKDDNPIKIAFYQQNNGVYKRVDTIYSTLPHFKDIGIFSIILSQDDSIQGNSIKELYREYSANYPNFSQYKIGYQIKFSLEDGTEFKETILKPKEYSQFSFYEYLYVWFYDDINTVGWHSHLVDSDDNTVMSSIKLMSTKGSDKIVSPIEIMVFTYDDLDFDTDGNYRGISKYKMLIERK